MNSQSTDRILLQGTSLTAVADQLPRSLSRTPHGYVCSYDFLTAPGQSDYTVGLRCRLLPLFLGDIQMSTVKTPNVSRDLGRCEVGIEACQSSKHV